MKITQQLEDKPVIFEARQEVEEPKVHIRIFSDMTYLIEWSVLNLEAAYVNVVGGVLGFRESVLLEPLGVLLENKFRLIKESSVVDNGLCDYGRRKRFILTGRVEKIPELRACSNCEWIFRKGPRGGLQCPKCRFSSYGAHFVYGRDACRFELTQQPWKTKKMRAYEMKLDMEIIPHRAEIEARRFGCIRRKSQWDL